MPRAYVKSQRREPLPRQFAPQTDPDEIRFFRDYDGTEYEVRWPRGRMLLSEYVTEANDEGRDR